MNRNKQMQILAGIALFAILFSVVSTALLVIFSWSQQAPTKEPSSLKDFIVRSGSLQKVDTKKPNDIILTWASVKDTWTKVQVTGTKTHK